MRRRTVLAAGGWLIAALAATGTGLAAVQVIGAGLTGPAGEVRTPDEVARALAAASAGPTPGGTVPGTGGPAGPSGPAVSGSPPPGVSASVPPVAGARLLATPGGTIVARCDGGQVWLVSWTPAQGFRAEDVDRGPDDDAEVTFRSATRRLDVEVECRDGAPIPSWQDKSVDDD